MHCSARGVFFFEPSHHARLLYKSVDFHVFIVIFYYKMFMKSSQICVYADVIAIVLRNVDIFTDMYTLMKAEGMKLVLW